MQAMAGHLDYIRIFWKISFGKRMLVYEFIRESFEFCHTL